jgi:hypothetical protein
VHASASSRMRSFSFALKRLRSGAGLTSLP